MFFNNFWTPVGAWASGETGFKHFMKGQRWWRELYRRADGAFNQAGRGGVGVSYALAYVAPKKRLRILGAPRSAFGTNCPDYLKPAIEAHKKRDYARCEDLIVNYMAENVLSPADGEVVNHLLTSVRILRASTEHDLASSRPAKDASRLLQAAFRSSPSDAGGGSPSPSRAASAAGEDACGP